MGLTLEEIEKLPPHIRTQIDTQVAGLKKTQSKVKSKGRAGNANWVEDHLCFLAKQVFEPEYSVSTQAKLVPDRQYSVDVYIEDLKCCLELDGWENHGKHLKDFKRDREKDMLLKLEGFTVFRFYATQVTRTPHEVTKLLKKIKELMENQA